MVVIGGSLLVAFFLDAHLEEAANALKTPDPAKAPWYFLGLLEVVSWSTPFIGGVLVLGLMVPVPLAIPYFRPNPEGAGAVVPSGSAAAVVAFTIGLVFNVLLIVVGMFFRGHGWSLVCRPRSN